jgi:transposase
MERLHMNEVREIIYRLRKGESPRAIGREVGFAKNTVKKYRDLAGEAGLLDLEKPLPDAAMIGELLGPPPRPRHMRSTVEPFAEVVESLVEQKVEMMAIWQRLRDEHGYRGSYSSVRRFVSGLRPKRPEAICRIETEPGEEAQVDFGSVGWQWDGKEGRRRRAWAFVMTLSWSRHQYVECVFDQKVETFVRCHERAFAWFGGVPERVVIDNLKAAVLVHDLHDPVLGEPYRRFAQHYGFIISPNRPRTPKHKGKVESGVHYVKRNFLAGRDFADLEALNARARRWVLEVAGRRCHGTTREAPLGRFELVERSVLKPLPEEGFDLVAAYRAKVHRDCHVVVNSRYYSVPSYLIGKQVEVYVGRRVVEIYEGTTLVSTHLVARKPGERRTRMDHYPAEKRAYLENPPARCRERAREIGEACAEVVDGLLDDRPYDRLRSVQALLRLAEEFGKERLEAACARALAYGDGRYRRIKGILKAGLDRVPSEEGVLEHQEGQRPEAYRYARQADSFFGEEVCPC